MADVKPYIDEDGEVRELDDKFFAKARRGRPPMPADKRKKRVNLMLAPDVVEALDRQVNKSETVNAAIRAHLGL